VTKNTAAQSTLTRPNWQRKLLSQAVAMASVGLQASAAMGAACPPDVPPNQTAACTVTGGGTVTVASSGTIIVPAVSAITLTGAGTKTITNSGTISGGNHAIDGAASTGTVIITNNAGATIAGRDTGIAIGSGNTIQINNAGTISATQAGASGSFTGVFVSSINAASTLTNTGTITASVTGPGDSATAYGIYVDDDVAGVLDNRDTINATASGHSSDHAYGIYVGTSIVTGGSLTNSGVINATATASSSASAHGIYVSSTIQAGGTLTNSGTINASATATSSFGSANAYGIYIESEMLGTLTNSGTINATAVASDSAYAAGIYLSSSLGAGGTLTNSGTINATATATGTQTEASHFAHADGIVVSGGLFGTLTNSGTINATATGGSAEAHGIVVTSGIGFNGSLSNSGHINATANASNGSASAVGILVSSTIFGTLTNSGSIDVTATATGGGSARAAGIGLDGGEGITNTSSGTITATASGSRAYAAGVYYNNNLDGALDNAGTIEATATGTGEGSAYAVGIAIGAMTSGSSLNNSGTITASASNASAFRADGIYVNSMQNGSTLTNSGTITRSGESGTAFGGAGIHVGFLDSSATLTNSGTVSANTPNGVGLGWAIAVDNGGESGASMVVNSAGGVLNGNVQLNGTSMNNSGLLSIPVVGSGFAQTGSFIGGNYTQLAGGVLEVGAHSLTEYGQLQVNGTADFTASGRFAVKVTPDDLLVPGGILQDVVHAGTLVSGGNANLSVTDNSALWNFTAIDDGESGIDLVIAGGISLTDAVNLNGPRWALGAAGAMDSVIDGGEATGDMANVIAELGTIPESQQLSAAAAQMVPVIVAQSAQYANLTLDSVSGLVTSRMDNRRASTVGEASHDRNLWVRTFANRGKQNQDGDVPGYDFHSEGLVVGYDTDVDSNWNVGGAFAYSQPQVNSDSPLIDDSISADSYQLAAYGYWDTENHVFVDLIAMAGLDNNDSARHIQFAGINETAHGSYDSWYTRLSAAMGKGFQLNDRLTLSPAFNLSYTYVSEDSYKESGAGALDLKVDDNDAKSLIVGLDGQLGYKADTALITAHAGVGYDTLTDEVGLTSAFVGGGPAFKTTGKEPEQMLVRAGLGVEVAPRSDIDLNFNYEYEYRDTFSNNLLVATLRWKI
jgi:outer membrane autotransporter protein